MEILNGIAFKQWLESGANNLMNHQSDIDALNVFPVPDGDTGTNMTLTFTAGVKDTLKSNADHVSDLAKILSKGLLMGARGNSGVILSQIFRGIYQGIEGMDEVNGLQLANAFVNGSRVAYKAVMRPVEGTILTVIREAADYTYDMATKVENVTCKQVIDKIVEEAQASLKRTPDLLPVLKEVGVVDSGGTGLLVILEGFQAAMDGHPIERNTQDETTAMAAEKMESEEFGYCTEFIIRLSAHAQKTFQEESLKNALARIGNSIVCVQDEDIVKVHVHTLTPGDALNLGQRHGEFVKLKIENMQEQHENVLLQAETSKPKPKQKYALIAVAAGSGLKDMFEELRVDYVISGGQTMNPSTEDFVEAIKTLNAEHIFILPNNSNIVLAAQQAASVCEDHQVHVIPSKTIPQGLCACINFNPDVEFDINFAEMNDALSLVKTGQITYAIKDTTFDGLSIKAGDFMGINEKDITVTNEDKIETTKQLLSQLIDEDSEIVTLIAGEDVSDDELQEVEAYLEENFEAEVEVNRGNQPVYSFVIGVE